MGDAGITSDSNWQDSVAAKLQDCRRKTPTEWLLSTEFVELLNASADQPTNLLKLDVLRRSGSLSEIELDITERYTGRQLLEHLASGKFSALEVTTAFSKRAAVAQQLLSCLTEVYYAEARERARFLDEYLKKEGKPIGPLHGLPISLKDSFCLKGLQSTVGWVSFLKHPPADSNSALVQMLLNLGAVPYVKTNIPQTMMTGDSENNIFGRTLNPVNTSLTAGGSSGGEAALIAFRGSILGVGTDIAGSIRIPALCCGIYGFKPSTHRIPFGGQVSGAIEGLPGPIPSAGPLGHSIDDLELFMQTVIDARPADYDSNAHPIPWQATHAAADTPLTIGVLWEEKVFPLHPPVRRVIKDAIEALSQAGHKIVMLKETPETSVSLANRITFQYYISGPDTSPEHFGPGGEPPVASVAKASNPMFSGPMPVSMDTDPLMRYDALHQQRQACLEAWRRVWVENQLDVILCPGAQNTAVPHDTFGWPPYTQIWNILDYPACIIPYGTVSKSLDPGPTSSDEFGPQPNYIPDAVHGAPCAIQIVGRRLEDEKCLAAARLIDQVLLESTGMGGMYGENLMTMIMGSKI